jgi:hypothetical protein
MTICPFMSRPVAAATHPLKYAEFAEVECQREKCAAWGPVEPLATIAPGAEGPYSGGDMITVLVNNEWKTIPSPGPVVKCGCRRIGGEVVE